MNNIIVDNYLGLMIDSEGNFNCIYHNTFNNTENAFDAGSENLWDKDYYDGFRPFGGNLWSDYNGNDEFSGPDQNIPGSDGIGDTVYDIDGRDSQDRYPLMKPWTGPLPATIYVDDNNTDPPWIGTPEHPYQYIQDAVEITMNGDRVFVFNGTYYENVVVHKSINLIGEDKNTVIIDGGGNGDVVQFRAMAFIYRRLINTLFLGILSYTTTIEVSMYIIPLRLPLQGTIL